MITRDLYISAVKALDRFTQKDIEIYNATNGVVDFTNFDELQDAMFALENLLERLTHDYDDSKQYYDSDLSYFLYDTEGGRSSVNADGTSRITDQNGDSIFMRNAEELYDNFIKPRYTNADYLTTLDTEDLADTIITMVKEHPTMDSLVDYLNKPLDL